MKTFTPLALLCVVALAARADERDDLGQDGFADSGGGNAKEIPVITYSQHLAPARAMFGGSPHSLGSSACKNGYRYIHRDPNPENDTVSEDSEPVPCN